MSENNHANLINELGNLYDKEYTTAWRAAKKARQEANREIERQLLERTRAWQARNGFDREPTPDPAEDSDDGLYHYEFEQTARDAGRVRCLTCNRFKKTCSLEENPRKACNFCREGGHKCFRMMSGVRYRGAPYAAGEPMADRGEDPGRIRPMGKYMWKEKTLKKNGVEVVAPERRDDDDEDEETMWSKPSQKKKEPKERAKTRGPYDTPRARERAAAMGSSSPVPPPRQFRDRKTRQSTVDEESEDDEYRQYRDRREPASTRRGRRSRSPETNRYGLRTTAEDFGNRLQYQEDEGNDADCVEERHRARSPSPRRIATPPPPPIPVEFPDFDINEFIDPNLANFQQDQGYPSSQLQADEELAAQALAQLSEQSQTPLVFEPPREPDEQVSSYAPARTLQPGTEQDQPYTFLTALNQLQAQSAPPGNGWNGQYELPQRPEQEAINAASVYGLNDNSAPESTSRVSNPISSLHPLNAEHLTEDMPVLNAAGVPTIPTNPQNNADPLAQLTTANYHGFNQMQFLVGNERWSPEEYERLNLRIALHVFPKHNTMNSVQTEHKTLGSQKDI
ncbi:hypothetical protein M7I_3875 [Glarea lozoyensis 74030]|uniref:Uncharacterized protein n=1 Tax=Glarea lozoyensis (strain ATCC 74030 / MF5533) TaxID=1104152 RepID=H0EMN6_GLAL7|nr:hypothetical protein M7I_3875 [Glarea lozoyensis 74030]